MLDLIWSQIQTQGAGCCLEGLGVLGVVEVPERYPKRVGVQFDSHGESKAKNNDQEKPMHSDAGMGCT